MKPLISIVLCTYNNADSLALTLNQLAAMHLPQPQLVEILIINNNSPDHTEQVSQAMAARHSHFRYYVEPQQGLSHARNTGLAHAQGDYVLFTDDDAEIPVHWVQNYIEQIHSHAPDCLYSKITIIWDKPKPWWFIREYTPCFVGLDYGDRARAITDSHHEFYGKNFCVRKTLLEALGGFDPKLGRQGTKLAAGEETLLYRHLVAQKKKVLYFPSAEVGHRLKAREYTSENITKLFVDGAYSSHHIAKLTARKTLFGRPARLLIDTLKTLVRSSFYYLLNCITRNKVKRFYHTLNLRKNVTLLKLWFQSP